MRVRVRVTTAFTAFTAFTVVFSEVVALCVFARLLSVLNGTHKLAHVLSVGMCGLHVVVWCVCVCVCVCVCMCVCS